MVILNRREATTLFGAEVIDGMLIVARSEGLHTVVITDSENGATILDGSYVYTAGLYKKVAVVDRSGAGYAYGSGLIASIIQGKTMQQAISFASANATSVISYLGTRIGILSNTEVDIMKIDISVFDKGGE